MLPSYSFSQGTRKVFHSSKHPLWRQAMQLEFEALQKNQTWTLIPRPPNTHIIWFWYKARLVAKEFSQQEGFNYFDSFSPVIKMTTVRLLLSIAISQRWHIHQLDVSNTFLHGDLSKSIIMEQPEGYKNSNFPNHVCKLHKSIYGLKQSLRAWFSKLSSYLSQFYRIQNRYLLIFFHK
ncbi:unnamed protein product [Spirodela intermedia]|uniref:Reverse transcriptase Ty1/copia-type domain-containing protein n=1 Tax=Spirodela intermedia TaxID=51605 RepID=A0ABN7EAD7_SPIIN|nr:unnamed protein product [Spirodela intermedia]